MRQNIAKEAIREHQSAKEVRWKNIQFMIHRTEKCKSQMIKQNT
jgi:hypothetical protein